MKKTFVLFFTILISVALYAQENSPVKFAETITQKDLKELLSIIASDALEGRDTGSRGQKMAAALIADHFKSLGLEPVVPVAGGKSYYQKFNLQRNSSGDTYIMLDDQKLMNGKEVLYRGSANSKGLEELKTVYAGDGSENAFSKIEVKNKAVIISAAAASSSIRREVSARAYEQGAALVLIEGATDDKEWQTWVKRYGPYVMRGSLGFANESKNNGEFYISPTAAAGMLSTSLEKYEANCAKVANGDFSGVTKMKSGSISFRIETKTEEIETENIMGYLEGTDKKDEIIVLSAHYDHVGKRGDKIYNGADDDGSGTTSILEIAEAFAEAKKAGHGPRRSILFMTVTGEEKGLLGSEYYTDHPVLPLEKTVVDLNIDMVGRVDESHKDNREFVYLVGSDRLSTELHQLSEKANATFTHLDLDYTYNDENHPDRIYYRSDHWNFAKNNIPIIFYFNGTHEDYHQPTDTVDKIEFDLLQQRAQLVFYTAWVIANRDQRLVVDKLSDTTVESK